MSNRWTKGPVSERQKQIMAKPNFAHQTIWTGDNITIMRGMNSECVDLICLDPPFNSNANYAAPIGSRAVGAEFRDTWTLNDIDHAWLDLMQKQNPAVHAVCRLAGTVHGDSMASYMCYMSIRLMEMHRILAPSGSIYLHCDPTASHYLKIAMDAVFHKKHFRNEIVWEYGLGGSSKRYFSRKHDVLLFYSKTNDYHFEKPQEPATVP